LLICNECHKQVRKCLTCGKKFIEGDDIECMDQESEGEGSRAYHVHDSCTTMATVEKGKAGWAE